SPTSFPFWREPFLWWVSCSSSSKGDGRSCLSNRRDVARMSLRHSHSGRRNLPQQQGDRRSVQVVLRFSVVCSWLIPCIEQPASSRLAMLTAPATRAYRERRRGASFAFRRPLARPVRNAGREAASGGNGRTPFSVAPAPRWRDTDRLTPQSQGRAACP